MKDILKMNIGIAGCGTMGLPMLEVLLKNKVKAITKDDYYITIDKKEIRNLRFFLEYDGPIKAPIQKDQKIASLLILDKDQIIKTIPLYASEKISKVNFFKSLITSINYLIWGDV